MKSPGTWSSRAGYSTWMNHHLIGLTIRPTKYSAEFMSASVPKLQDEKLQKTRAFSKIGSQINVILSPTFRYAGQRNK